MRTTAGLRRVDVIYRRVDDDFIDPLAFRPDSRLGVPGLFNAYRAGNVSIINAIGTGVADDKAVYAYVPAIIRFYLSEEPILPNVQTYMLGRRRRPRVRARAPRRARREGGGRVRRLRHADRSAQHRRRSARSSDGESWRIRATTSRSRRSRCRARRTSSTTRLEARHVDLRPYVLCGESFTVVPGGLTRVALRRGSLVVNSSQGGGSKDTWVLAD